METLVERLSKLGLTGNEARMYFEMLRRGSISANELAKTLSIDRTLSYQILQNLIAKGLVSYIIKEKKKFFEAASPENLLTPIKEKEQAILSIIPELISLVKIKEQEQNVKVYEGKQGLKTFFEDIISSKNVCIFGSTGNSYDLLKFEIPHIAKKAHLKGLRGRMITSKKFIGHEMTKLPNIKVKYLEEIKSPATTTIYGDKIAIHILTSKPIIIIIKNNEISESYKNYFEFLWGIATS